MSDDLKINTVELILTDATSDYSKNTGKSLADVRNEIIDSGAYDSLYDFDTGLWTQGPDYFIDYFLKLKHCNNSNDEVSK